MSVFLFLLVPKLFGDAAYYVLNRTINYEWRDEAKCGELKVKNKNEKYFGFNTDKYTVFYSDKNDKWGFYELTCQKVAIGTILMQSSTYLNIIFQRG